MNSWHHALSAARKWGGEPESRPADSFTEGGLGEAIVLARTVEQMVTGMGHLPTRPMPPQPPVSYTCGTAFCGTCGCCLNCFPFCCEGGCSP